MQYKKTSLTYQIDGVLIIPIVYENKLTLTHLIFQNHRFLSQSQLHVGKARLKYVYNLSVISLWYRLFSAIFNRIGFVRRLPDIHCNTHRQCQFRTKNLDVASSSSREDSQDKHLGYKINNNKKQQQQICTSMKKVCH